MLPLKSVNQDNQKSPCNVDSEQNVESILNKIYPKEVGASTSFIQITENTIFITNSREIATKTSKSQYISQGNMTQDFPQRNNLHKHSIKNTSNKNVSNATIDSFRPNHFKNLSSEELNYNTLR